MAKTSTWALYVLIISIVYGQDIRSQWQSFNNDRITREHNRDRSNSMNINIESGPIVNTDESTEENSIEGDFDIPSDEIDSFFDKFFDKNDPDFDFFETPALRLETDSIQIRTGSGDIKEVDLTDIAHNAQLEHLLLLKNPFKDFQDIGRTRTPRRQADNTKQRVLDLSEQIKMQVEAMQQQSAIGSPTATTRRQRQTQGTSHLSNQIPSLPMELIRGLFNKSAAGILQYPLQLNHSAAVNNFNKTEQRTVFLRRPDKILHSSETVTNDIRNGNRHISRSKVHISTSNSSSTFSTLKSLPTDVRRIVESSLQNSRLQPAMQPAILNNQRSPIRTSHIGDLNANVHRSVMQSLPFISSSPFHGNPINTLQIQQQLPTFKVSAPQPPIFQSSSMIHSPTNNIQHGRIAGIQSDMLSRRNQRHFLRNGIQINQINKLQTTHSQPTFLTRWRQAIHSPTLSNRLQIIPNFRRRINNRNIRNQIVNHPTTRIFNTGVPGTTEKLQPIHQSRNTDLYTQLFNEWKRSQTQTQMSRGTQQQTILSSGVPQWTAQRNREARFSFGRFPIFMGPHRVPFWMRFPFGHHRHRVPFWHNRWKGLR